MNLSYRHILKYTGIFGGIQAISMLASIVRNKAAAIFIDRYGQGLSDLFSNAANLVSTATTLVMPVSVIRRLSQVYERHGDGSAELRDEIRVVRSWSVLTGLVAMVIVAVGARLLSRFAMGSDNFVRSFIFLSPLLVLMSVNATEVAILKATRRLRQLAWASGAGAVATMVVSVISYWLWGLRGIVIALNAGLLATTVLNMCYTLRPFPYRVAPFRWSVLRKGGPLISLSISFMLASLVAALAEMLIRSFISNQGSIEDVGLYGAGFVLTVTYTKFIFSAMDADFYPRLSGIADNLRGMNVAINRQVVVCVLLIVPCLMLFTLFLPQIVRLLYRPEYLEIVPMVLCATLYMYSKAVITPVAYTALAKGDSRMFFVIEVIAAVLLGACVIGGYHVAGLTGSGVGLALSNVVELTIIMIVYNRAYGVRLYKSTVGVILLQMLLLIVALLCIAFCGVMRYPIVIAMVLLSAFFAWRKLR